MQIGCSGAIPVAKRARIGDHAAERGASSGVTVARITGSSDPGSNGTDGTDGSDGTDGREGSGVVAGNSSNIDSAATPSTEATTTSVDGDATQGTQCFRVKDFNDHGRCWCSLCAYTKTCQSPMPSRKAEPCVCFPKVRRWSE